MTTFALFYNTQDLAAIAGSLTNPGLSGQDRNEVNRYWNGGLNAWSSAPAGVSPMDDPNDPTNAATKMIVVSGNQVSRAGFVTLLRRLAATYGPDFEWLRGLSNDVEGPVPGGNNSGSWEPWPPV